MCFQTELCLGCGEYAPSTLGAISALHGIVCLACSFDLADEELPQTDDEGLSDYDESMDGDFDSGMASAGFGTDEDYGYFGESDYDEF